MVVTVVDKKGMGVISQAICSLQHCYSRVPPGFDVEAEGDGDFFLSILEGNEVVATSSTRIYYDGRDASLNRDY